MENNIGKVLHIDEAKYQKTVQQWERCVFPSIKRIANKYNSLGIGELNQQVFEEMLKKGFNGVGGVAQISSLSSLDNDTIMQIAIELNYLFKAHYEASGASTIQNYLNMPWDDVLIENGAPALNKEKIRKRHEYAIANDVQNELYSRMLRVKSEWNELLHFVNAKGFNTDVYAFFGKGGFLFMQDDTSIDINPQSIKFLQ